MNKSDLLRRIAETGYDIGYGAKKNFSTHDIVQKAPGLVGSVSLVVGVFSLVWEFLSAKWIGATLVASSAMSLYISQYDHKKSEYSEEGERLTELLHRLHDLYADVRGLGDDIDLGPYRERYDEIRAKAARSSQSKQILFSDWYAHYKFFWQGQIGWMDEQLHFSLWRDKVPLTLSATVVMAIILSVVVIVYAKLC